MMLQEYRAIEPTDAEVAAVVSRVLEARAGRPRLRSLALALATIVICAGLSVALPAGRAAFAGRLDSLQRFLGGGSSPGSVAPPPTGLTFMRDFVHARPGAVRVLARTADGEKLVAVRATIGGRPNACFDYGHHYADCSPVGSPPLFAHGPIALVLGTRSHTPHRAALWALVADQVVRVTLRYRDGGAQTERVRHGVAMLFDPERRATELIARGAGGRVLVRYDVRNQLAWLIAEYRRT